MLTEVKVESVYRKKRFRPRRNPKQRKFRKKKQKKSHMQTDRERDDPCRRVAASYGESFWHNYSKAIDWSTSYIESYWKLEAHRLQRENALLRNRLESLMNYQVEDEPSESLEDDGFCTEEKSGDATDATSDLEVSEEFMKFIEVSLKHKLSQKKNRSRDNNINEGREEAGSSDQIQEEVFEAPREDNGMKRNTEMKELYGRDSAKIQGMETAVHLGFLRKCDKRKPVVWPVVPLAPVHH